MIAQAGTTGFRRRRRRRLPWHYLALVPTTALLLLITILPIGITVRTAFSRVSLAGLIKEFVGIKNFQAAFSSPDFIRALSNTLLWTASIVSLTVVVSIFLALLFEKRFPGRSLARGILIIPWATPLLVSAMVWKWVLNFEFGAANKLLLDWGIIQSPVYWEAQPVTSFPAMIFIGIILSIPFTTMVFLSGLQSIPTEVHEAAVVEGASAVQHFGYVTLPLLRPSFNIALVLNAIYVFNSFPLIWVFTRGGPAHKTDTLVTLLYKVAFDYNRMGPAAAISVVSVALLLVLASLYVKLAMSREG